jgi:hypothetical protein
MNNLVWVFFSMAAISTPTPSQIALFDPRKPLRQLAEKKCPRVLAGAPVMHARAGSCITELSQVTNSAPLYVVTVAGDAQVVQRAITAITTALATERRPTGAFIQLIKLLFVLSPLGLRPVTKVQIHS